MDLPLPSVIRALRSRVPSGGERCMACGRAIRPRDERLRLRGDLRVHRECATYSRRRRRTGASRLGYPPS